MNDLNTTNFLTKLNSSLVNSDHGYGMEFSLLLIYEYLCASYFCSARVKTLYQKTRVYFQHFLTYFYENVMFTRKTVFIF